MVSGLDIRQNVAMLPSYKDIVDLIKKGSTIEAHEKIMELREAAIQLQEENLELRQRLKALEEQIALRAKVVWEKPYYWIIDEGGKRDGPYCQSCYDKDSKLMRLQDGENGVWNCKVCKSTFVDSTYRTPQVKHLDDDWRS